MLLRRSAGICAILLIALPSFPHSQDKKRAARNTPECGYDWPKQEVPWIITDQESAAFHSLPNDEERTRFIELFWNRRDPTPDTLENGFKDTYYDRVIFANEHFSTSKELGFQTPRGRIFVMYGPPDTLERKVGIPPIPPTTAVVGNPCDPTSPTAGPYEIWQYRHIARIDHLVTITFADACGTGELLPVVDQTDRGWLSRSPTPKYKPECNGRYDPNNPPAGPQAIVCLENFPVPQFKELDEIVSHKISLTDVPFQVGYEFKVATTRTVATTIKLTFSPTGLKWANSNGSTAAHVQLYGQLTTQTGYIVESFERDETFSDSTGPAKLQIPLYMASGAYQIDLAVQDVNGNTFGTFSRALRVPNLGSWCQR